jgi:hypothetical protein
LAEAVVGQVPSVITEQVHGVQSPLVVIVTPPATLVSGVPHAAGHPSDGVMPFSRTMGPCQLAGTDGTHVPVQPLLVLALLVLALEEAPLVELVLDAVVEELVVLEVDVAPPIPELVVLVLDAPPLPAAPPRPPEEDDESPAVPVLDACEVLVPP